MVIGAACLLAGAAGVPAQETPDALLQAREAIEKQEYDSTISLLSDLSGETTETAAFHYLLGLAVFRKNETAVEALRDQREQSPDTLTEDQAAAYREALDHFRKVVDIDPQGPDTPEAHYLIALLLDYGYLQRFGQFVPEYRKVVESYPGTEAAGKAQEKLEYHDQLFKHGAKEVQ
jgi:tetratricopeptide (TPR) repeat protein